MMDASQDCPLLVIMATCMLEVTMAGRAHSLLQENEPAAAASC